MAAFHRAFDAAPGDHTPHLVFADFLEDRGQSAAAEVIRRGIEQFKTKEPHKSAMLPYWTGGYDVPAAPDDGFALSASYGYDSASNPTRHSLVIRMPSEAGMSRSWSMYVPWHTPEGQAEARRIAETLASEGGYVGPETRQWLGMAPEEPQKLARSRTPFAAVYVSPSTRENSTLPDAIADLKRYAKDAPTELAEGMTVEQEHTPRPAVQQKIAEDHLRETPNYYDKLAGMEDRPRHVISKTEGVRSYEPAIGAWKDGAEASYVVHVTDPARLTKVAAQLGKAFKQKGVVTFRGSPSGPDLLHRVVVSGLGLRRIHELLAKSGIEYHTAVPKRGRFVVHVLDRGGELAGRVKAFARSAGGKYHQTRGQFEELGGATRELARQDYERRLKLERHPDMEGFHQAFHKSRRDLTPQLVYADWLDEHGNPGAALAIRHAVDARRDSGSPMYIHNNSVWSGKPLEPGEFGIHLYHLGPEGSKPTAYLHHRSVVDPAKRFVWALGSVPKALGRRLKADVKLRRRR